MEMNEYHETMQDEIDARRAESEKRFVDITTGKCSLPDFKFLSQNFEETLEDIENLTSGTIVISFHTKAYFILFALLSDQHIPFIVITTEELAQRLKSYGEDFQQGFESSHTLTHTHIKKCVKKECYLFIMADVLVEYASNSWVPLLNRCVNYTISWAELAHQFKLNIVVALLKDGQDVVEVYFKLLEKNHSSPFALCCSVFNVFGEFIKNDLHLWENFPQWQVTGLKLPSIEKGLQGDLSATLYNLAICDKDIYSIVQQELSKGGEK